MTNTEITNLKNAEKKANETIDEMAVVRVYTLEAGDITMTAEVQACGETTVRAAGEEYLYGSEEEFKAALSDAVKIVKVEEMN